MAMLSLTAVACQQLEEQQPQPVVSDQMVFVAQTESYGSPARTVLNAEGMIEWSATDQIAIFKGGSTAAQYEISTGAGSSYAEFTVVNNNGDTGEGDGEWVRAVSETFDANVALYPYAEELSCTATLENEELVSCTISGVTLPSVQNYVANSFAEGAFAMVSITQNSDDNVLRFNNVGGALKLQLTGTDAITSIALAGNAEEPLAGEATVTVYADGTTKPQIEMAANASKGVTLSCGAQGVQLNEETPTTFIIATPPTSFANGFTLTLTNTEGQTATLSTSKANPIERSMILAMPACKVEFAAADATDDLSANGTANCYIVTKAGNYKFKATQGCSNVAVGAASVSGYAHPEGTPATAAVLWETFGTSTQPTVGDLIKADVEYKDGYVHFSTADTFTKGNALIVVKDENGTILWSWHIWLTDRPAEQVYVNNAGTMMDRNLGATSATPGDVGALGLLYQWGRKDPFVGADAIVSYKDDLDRVLSDFAQATTPFGTSESNETRGTVDYAIKNPNVYLYKLSGDWLYGATMANDATRWSSEKTIYDPCPAGWRVPDQAVWLTANSNNPNITKVTIISDSTNKGLNIEGFVGTGEIVWYPFAGRRCRSNGGLSDGNNNSVVGSNGYYWNVSYNAEKSSFSPYHFRIFIGNGSYFGFNSGDSPVVGKSVRCVKIKE